VRGKVRLSIAKGLRYALDVEVDAARLPAGQ
jgi:hypothetical protein